MNMQAQTTGATPCRWSDQHPIAYMHKPHVVQIERAPEQRARLERTTFEIHNQCGKTAHGIEIEVQGFGEDDVFCAYYLNRYGSPAISRSANSIHFRFECLWRTAARMLSLTNRSNSLSGTRDSIPHLWELAIIGNGSSERFRLELSTRDVIATFRWLVAADGSSNSLVPDHTPAGRYDASNGTIHLRSAG